MPKVVSGLIKRLFCRHEYHLHRILCGDEIIGRDYKRYELHCKKCNSYKFSREKGFMDGLCENESVK